MMTQSQEEAYHGIKDRLSRGLRLTRLSGNAGSGKTWLAGQIADSLSYECYAVAPTHKAAYVLSTKTSVETRTVHSFLGLKMKPDYKGGYELVADYKNPPPRRGVVFCDEASMIGEDLWSFIETSDLQWVFLGDPAQLPPVEEDPSPALSLDGFHLCEIVRQAQDNPILKAATAVREGRSWSAYAHYDEGKGIAVTRDRNAILKSAAACFQVDRDHPPTARILAYRNSVVTFYNNQMRALLHGDHLKRFVPGEWVMMRETYFNGSVALAKNSQELAILGSYEDAMEDDLGERWRVWRLTALSYETGQEVTLPVLHESESYRFKKTVAQYKKEAIKDERPWTDYYALLETFADLDYAYALTVHKSQGSTFENVYVDYRDLVRSKPDERRALIYVAFTRPSDRLALLTG